MVGSLLDPHDLSLPLLAKIVHIVVSLVFLITIIGLCIGETWVYYLLGSLVEVVLLVAIARTAWKWPPPQARAGQEVDEVRLGASGAHNPHVERQTVTRTRRLVVTTWMPGDVDDLYELHSDPLTMRFVGPGRPETREECEHRLTSYLSEHRTRGWTKWRVQTLKGSMIGRAGFGAHGPNRELGYTLRPDSWGHGLATELAGALVHWHTENPDPDAPPDLWAYAAVENIASRRVLEKVGFDFVDDRDHHGTSCAFYVFTHGPRVG